MNQNKNFASMKTKVGNNVQDTSSSFLTLIGGWLNDKYVEVSRRIGIVNNVRLDYSISASTEDITLPDDLNDVVSLVDKTNKIKLTQVDFQTWLSGDVSAIDTAGTSMTYAMFDDVVALQPTSASTITFVSSSSADTTQTIYVRGVVSGADDYETATLNGTTNVVTTKNFSRIYGIGFSASRTGVITVTSNSGAVTNATIGREALQTRYKKIRLIPPPSQAITLEMTYTQKLIPMSQDYDYPIIDVEDVIEAGATADAWRYKRQNAKADFWDTIFDKRLDDWMWARENKADMVHTFKPSSYPRNYY